MSWEGGEKGRGESSDLGKWEMWEDNEMARLKR